jgi:putative MFS transporter
MIFCNEQQDDDGGEMMPSEIASTPAVVAGAAAERSRIDAVSGTGTIIPARLERLPMTTYQRGIFLIIATAWFFDSVDLGSLTFVLGSIRTDFGLTTAQLGLLSSMSFVGMFAGAALAGMLADRWGRKLVFQMSMILWGLGSLWCALASSIITLSYARLLLGFGMGMEFPVALAIVSEFLPARRRGRYIAILEGFWPLGFIGAGLLSLILLSEFSWRSVFLCQAIPALFVFIIRFYVPESPRWLADRGRYAEANAVMSRIEEQVARHLSGASLPDPQPLPQYRTTNRFSFLELWSKGYAVRTTMIWLVWFFALLGFYGLTTWLGALLQAAGYSVTKSVSYTLLISLAGIPGFICAAWLIEAWGRKPTAVLMLLGSAVAAFFYGHAATQTQLVIYGLAMQFFLFGMWSVLYAYTPEIYPTRARATGAGCASAIGRIGALIGPYVVGVILPSVGNDGVFALGAGSFALAAASVAFLGIETKGKSLEAISE